MFTQHIGNRFEILDHPSGGVAPLRRDLAVYDYLKRQNEIRQDAPLTSVPSWAKQIFRTTWSSVKRTLSWLRALAYVPDELPR